MVAHNVVAFVSRWSLPAIIYMVVDERYTVIMLGGTTLYPGDDIRRRDPGCAQNDFVTSPAAGRRKDPDCLCVASTSN